MAAREFIYRIKNKSIDLPITFDITVTETTQNSICMSYQYHIDINRDKPLNNGMINIGKIEILRIKN